MKSLPIEPEPLSPHPPMMPGAMPARRTVWPTVLGVISIAFGGAAALMAVWGMLAPLLFRSMGSQFSQSGFDPFAAMNDWRLWLLVSNSLTLAAAVLLVIGGVLLTRRSPAARRTLLAWAIVKMLVVVLSSCVGYQVSQSQFAALQQAGQMPPRIMSVMGTVGIGIGLAWGWALPVFMIIWFCRTPIRNDVATWRVTAQRKAQA